MARIHVQISNNTGSAINLPERLGGYEVADGGTQNIHLDTQRFKSLEHTDPAKTFRELEELAARDNVTVDIFPVIQDEDTQTLENQLEAAEAYGMLGGRVLRMGTGTVTGGGSATQTFDFTPDLPDSNYKVMVTFLGDQSPSTASNAIHERVTNKGTSSFDLTFENVPSADVDFDFFIFAEPG